MIDRIGLDAIIFLRFLRLCRNYLAVIALLGCAVLIPINIVGTNATINASTSTEGTTNPLLKLTVAGLVGKWMIPHIALSYVFTATLMYFIWFNYAAVVRLRQKYFSSDEYQSSLHARTIMAMDVPIKERSDNALAHRAIQFKNASKFSQAQMGRDVGKLPHLIEKHEEAVRKLEDYLAKYLKNPAKLPAHRPTCKGANGRVDAIDFYTNRVQSLERQVETARESYDALRTQSYGFVSYPSIPAAHEIAKHNKSNRLFLAPKSTDLIWKNLSRPAAKRHANRIFGNFLFVIFCILWTVPNALIATFISNIYNLGSVWPWFQRQINDDPKLWAVLQGILGPIILGIFFLILPSIMRRISEFEGSLTRNARERMTFHKLFLFFFINNFFLFTIFGVIWNFVQVTIVASAESQVGFSGFWSALKTSQFFDGLAAAVTSTSTFWIIYVAQRNLGCLLDLVQVWGMFLKWFKRTFLAPSPREMIEWSAPQNFDYASYYNTFLYNFTICISYATLAPLILPFGLLYFVVSGATYKYSMLYVTVTKVESGGTFWRILINRLLLNMGFSNLVLFLIVWVKVSIFTAISVTPIFLILAGFKIALVRHFDSHFDYYLPERVDEAGNVPVVHKNDEKKDRLRSRFGHPSLHQKLIVPMVHERSRHLLREVYKGRLHEENEETAAVAMAPAELQEKFEVVAPDNLDFDTYRNRPEFAKGHGDIYSGHTSSIRSGTTAPVGRSPFTDSTPPRRPVPARSASSYTANITESPLGYKGYAPSSQDEESLFARDGESTYELDTYHGRPQFDSVSMNYESQEDLTNLLRPGSQSRR